MTYVSIIVGSLCILIAMFVKNFDYARGLTFVSGGKRAPRWQGQLMFAIVGGVFLISGLLELFGVIGHQK